VQAAFFMVGIYRSRRTCPSCARRVRSSGNMTSATTRSTHPNMWPVHSADRTFDGAAADAPADREHHGALHACCSAPRTMPTATHAGRDELAAAGSGAPSRTIWTWARAVDPEDWEPGVTADEIFRRVIKGVEQRQRPHHPAARRRRRLTAQGDRQGPAPHHRLPCRPAATSFITHVRSICGKTHDQC
jgi:hypothetical protein